METVHFLLLKAWVGWRLLSDPHPAHHSCFGDCGGIDRECVWGVGRECLWGVPDPQPDDWGEEGVMVGCKLWTSTSCQPQREAVSSCLLGFAVP